LCLEVLEAAMHVYSMAHLDPLARKGGGCSDTQACNARSLAPDLQQVGYTSRCCDIIDSPNKSIMETAKAAQPIHSLIDFNFFHQLVSHNY